MTMQTTRKKKSVPMLGTDIQAVLAMQCLAEPICREMGNTILGIFFIFKKC